MATLAQDDFNRANANLDGVTMSDGSNTWATINASGFAVVSNQCASAHNYGAVEARGTNINSLADGRVSAAYISGTSGLLFRIQSTVGNHYQLSVDGGVLKLYKVTAWSRTQLGSNGSAVSSTDVVGLQASSTTISTWLNGSQDDSQTDSTWTGGGNPGLRCYGSAGVWDDFIVESLAAAGGGFFARRYYDSLLAGAS